MRALAASLIVLAVVAAGAATRTASAPNGLVRVVRVPQRYTRLGIRTYRFEVVGGEFEAELEIDEFGLVVTYPGLAQRVA